MAHRAATLVVALVDGHRRRSTFARATGRHDDALEPGRGVPASSLPTGLVNDDASRRQRHHQGDPDTVARLMEETFAQGNVHLKSVVNMDALPELRFSHPEVCFVGHTQVGKSKVCSLLLGNDRLLRVGNAAGKRALGLTFYAVGRALCIVDAPGFGAFSHTSHKASDSMFHQSLVKQYIALRKNANLKRVYWVFSVPDLIAYGGLRPREEDIALLLAAERVPFVAMLNKADILTTKSARQTARDRLREQQVALDSVGDDGHGAASDHDAGGSASASEGQTLLLRKRRSQLNARRSGDLSVLPKHQSRHMQQMRDDSGESFFRPFRDESERRRVTVMAEGLLPAPVSWTGVKPEVADRARYTRREQQLNEHFTAAIELLHERFTPTLGMLPVFTANEKGMTSSLNAIRCDMIDACVVDLAASSRPAAAVSASTPPALTLANLRSISYLPPTSERRCAVEAAYPASMELPIADDAVSSEAYVRGLLAASKLSYRLADSVSLGQAGHHLVDTSASRLTQVSRDEASMCSNGVRARDRGPSDSALLTLPAASATPAATNRERPHVAAVAPLPTQWLARGTGLPATLLASRSAQLFGPAAMSPALLEEERHAIGETDQRQMMRVAPFVEARQRAESGLTESLLDSDSTSFEKALEVAENPWKAVYGHSRFGNISLIDANNRRSVEQREGRENILVERDERVIGQEKRRRRSRLRNYVLKENAHRVRPLQLEAHGYTCPWVADSHRRRGSSLVGAPVRPMGDGAVVRNLKSRSFGGRSVSAFTRVGAGKYTNKKQSWAR